MQSISYYTYIHKHIEWWIKAPISINMMHYGVKNYCSITVFALILMAWNRRAALEGLEAKMKDTQSSILTYTSLSFFLLSLEFKALSPSPSYHVFSLSLSVCALCSVSPFMWLPLFYYLVPISFFYSTTFSTLPNLCYISDKHPIFSPSYHLTFTFSLSPSPFIVRIGDTFNCI